MIGNKKDLMIDLKKLDEKIEIVSYNPSWPALFKQEAEELKKIFEPHRLVALEHYGSSSVPGLCSKPIVDILVGLDEFKLSDDEIKKLEALGYEFIGQLHPTVQRFFLRKRGTQNFNLGVVTFDSTDWHNNLVTRDYLRTHPDEVKTYTAVKQDAVGKGFKTLIEYHKYKDAFVNGLRERAIAWKKNK